MENSKLRLQEILIQKNLVTYAETGVNYISMGSLTNTAVPIDLSLKAV